MASAAQEQLAESMLMNLSGVKEGKSFLASLAEKIQAMRNYQFDSTLTCYGKNKPVTETGHFYFKAPKLVRFEAVSAGPLSGSIVVRQADGKVRAKSKTFFGMTMSLSPRSKLLQTPNGFNILDSDLSTLIESLQKSLASDLKCLVTDSPKKYPGLENAYIFEVMHDTNTVLQRIVLDGESKLPREWSLFNGDKLFSVLRIEKLSSSPDLADNLFALNIADGGAKSMQGDETAADKVEDCMSALARDSQLGPANINDAKSAIKTLLLQCDSIEQLTPAIQLFLESHSTLKSNTVPPEKKRPMDCNSLRQNILKRTTTIESIADSLSKLKKIMERLESGTILSKQWQENLDAIDASTCRMYELIDAEIPDNKLLSLETQRMRKHSLLLESIVNQLYPKI